MLVLLLLGIVSLGCSPEDFLDVPVQPLQVLDQLLRLRELAQVLAFLLSLQLHLLKELEVLEVLHLLRAHFPLSWVALTLWSVLLQR